MEWKLIYTVYMAIGIEQRDNQMTPEEIAAIEVDNYLESVEKKQELDKDVTSVLSPVVDPQSVVQPVVDEQGQTIMSVVPTEPEIDLPLSEPQVREGLHHKVWDSFRWLSEWCVMIIKKYPGRVFYKE